MDVLSNGQRSTTRRRRILRGLAIGVAALAALAIPGGAASAGKPVPPNPMRPFVDGSYIVGQTQNSNFCAGIYCHTYLSVMIKDGTTYRLYDGWWDISALPNVQYYGAQLVEGTHSYKTSVHDFVTVAGSCGASSRTFYGKTYKRFSCEGATTTYMRIYTSTSRTVFFDD